ncbi:hypothetical protein Vwe01_51720 [Micromonospora andamanensis]|nr:hypothetical protein Vwe01_51720 [Micromonospora andamanensis]
MLTVVRVLLLAYTLGKVVVRGPGAGGEDGLLHPPGEAAQV